MITPEQLSEAIREYGRPGEDRRIGDVFVETGFIDATQLAKLLAAQRQVVAKQQANRSTNGANSPPAATPPAKRGLVEKPAAAPTANPEPVQAAAPPPPDVTPAAPRAEPAAAPPASTPAAAPSRARAPESAEPAATKAPPAPRSDASREVETAFIVREEALARPDEADREAFVALLKAAVERGASDIHLHAGAPPMARVAGTMLELDAAALEPERVERMLLSVLTPEQRRDLARLGELDACHSIGGLGRFRANFYREQRGFDGVFRHIPDTPPSLEQLGLPLRLAKFTTYHQGMVLVTGPTGCGKSSTLASLVDLINQERTEHILSIEDPIEYLHPSKRCLVNQRSAQHHTESFARALRAALREDPDVIVIGELRDLETISLALTAAETGHFVLATLHTENAIRTINRMVGSFPADQQDQIRTMISESLRAVISQRLVPRADGSGRVPAIETLVITKAVGNLIRENKTFQIQSILQTGSSQGMTLLDNSLRALVDEGTVTREEALRHCEDPKVLAA